VFHLIPNQTITESTFEDESVYTQTRKIVEESTYTTTIESYLITQTKTTVPSRNIITPTFIIIGLIIVIVGLVAFKGVKPQEQLFCINCRHPLTPGDRFCENCGAQQ
jgi:hypothetical protein